MWVSQKNHRELGWAAASSLTSPLIAVLELQPSWQRGRGTVCADGDVHPFAEVKDANMTWLKWGCLDRCILSLPIFLLKQKELRDAKIQQTSKSFSFYFPCKGKYLKIRDMHTQCFGSWDLGSAAVMAEAPALKCQATDPHELLAWMVPWELILCCRKPRSALSHKKSWLSETGGISTFQEEPT